MNLVVYYVFVICMSKENDDWSLTNPWECGPWSVMLVTDDFVL